MESKWNAIVNMYGFISKPIFFLPSKQLLLVLLVYNIKLLIIKVAFIQLDHLFKHFTSHILNGV